MSGGTSAGNIVTEVPGTYAARTWRSVVKVDAFGAIVDAQLSSIIGANWFNNVDDNLAQLNNWLNGTGKAALIKATAMEVDGLDIANDLSVDNIDVANQLDVFGNASIAGTLEVGTVDAGIVGATTANISTANITSASIGTSNTTGTAKAAAMVAGSGLIADATIDADDLVVGNVGATDRGVSILSTSVAKVAFSDTVNTTVGYISYTHASDTMQFATGGTNRLTLSSSTLSPNSDNGLTFGSSVLRYANAHLTDITLYSGLTLGDATGAPNVIINKDTAQQSNILFKSEGVTEFHIRHEANFIGIGRYVAGVYSSAIQFDQPVGDLYIPGTVYLSAGDIEMSKAGAQIRAGNGSSTPVFSLSGAAGGTINFKNSSNNKAFEILANTAMNIDRYSAGVLTDSIVYDNTGGVTIPNVLTVGGSSVTNPGINIGKSDASQSALSFLSAGNARWAWLVDSSEDLILRRYSAGGATLSSSTFSNSTGALTFPHDVSLPGANRVLTVGDGTGSPTVLLNKSVGGSGILHYQDNDTTRWMVKCNAVENLLFERYNSSGVLQDSTTVSGTTGSWTFPGSISVSGQTRRLTSGSGAPVAAATNGDIYWRIDGAISTTLYIRLGGVWTAAVLT